MDSSFIFATLGVTMAAALVQFNGFAFASSIGTPVSPGLLPQSQVDPGDGDGDSDGLALGDCEAETDGDSDGLIDIDSDGLSDGDVDGLSLGDSEGELDALPASSCKLIPNSK